MMLGGLFKNFPEFGKFYFGTAKVHLCLIILHKIYNLQNKAFFKKVLLHSFYLFLIDYIIFVISFE
jgi:hypothetical protein